MEWRIKTLSIFMKRFIVRNKNGININGKTIDDETRCVHYHGASDIIAIKFKCCGDYYPCYSCHHEQAEHSAITWTKNERDTKAILCGKCGNELSIHAYVESGNQCPFCNAAFNPNCKNHYHLYFEI
jgi:uncharacterized CHY-type Zn-finger protein